jgi:hypothetical protein
VLVVAVLIALAGASLLLLPGTERSYRAVASATTGNGAPACVDAATDEVGTERIVAAVARRARVERRAVPGRTEVLPPPPGTALRVAFRGDSAYLAQQGARIAVLESVRAACVETAAELLTDLAVADERAQAAEEALRARPGGAGGPPPRLVADRDQALEDLAAAQAAFDRQDAVPVETTAVDGVTPVASGGGALERLAPAGAALLCVLVALAVLLTGWRRAAAAGAA